MPQSQPSVPKFGSWDVDDGMPYTMVFEDARASKRGATTASTDPISSLSDFYMNYFENRHADSSSQKASADFGSDFTILEGRVGRQDTDIKREALNNALGKLNGLQSHMNHHESPHMHNPHHFATSKPEGSLHPSHYKRSTCSDGVSSASYTEDGRSRPRSSKGDTAVGVAVPKFGDWDENNPASGEGFTTIFNHARAVKKTEINPPLNMPLPASVRADQDLYKPDSSRKTSKRLWNMICCRHVEL